MARSRNIKPGFFKNESLAECGAEAMLLFAGLWTIADRSGRLEDRPRRIKVEVFPYFDYDVDRLLDDLAAAGFIIRYEIEGKRLIAIPKFGKHQNPHKREAVSTIPAPDGSVAEGHDEHSADTVQDPEIPERARLIPSSLIPSSLIPSPEAAASSEIEPPPLSPEELHNELGRVAKSKAFRAKRDSVSRETEHTESVSEFRWFQSELRRYPFARRLPQRVFETGPDPPIVQQVIELCSGDRVVFSEALLGMYKAEKHPTKSWAWFVTVMPAFIRSPERKV